MSSSNCCFLSCIQVSQEASKVISYSHLFTNFPHFVVIYTVKGFSAINETKVDVFWNSLAFSMIQRMLAIWSLLPLLFLNPACTSGSYQFMYCWGLAWRILGMFFWHMKWVRVSFHSNCTVIWTFFGIAFLWYWNEKWPFPILWPLLCFPNLLAYWVQHFNSIIF